MKQGRFILEPERFCVWQEVKVMNSFPQRLVGMLMQGGLPRGQAYWFPSCTAVHSWGMQFAMDIVGLDAQQRIVAVRRNVQPGVMIRLRGTRSIIECESGFPYPLEQWCGRQLHFEEHEVDYAVE